MTNAKQNETQLLRDEVTALAAQVAALHADTCQCREIQTSRARAALDQWRSRMVTIAHLPRAERNAALAALDPADLAGMFASIGETAIKVIAEAPDHATQDAWLAHVNDVATRRRVRVHMHRMVPRVRVHARAGLTTGITPRTIVISREQADRLIALGHDPAMIVMQSAFVEDERSPWLPSKQVHRHTLITRTIDASYRWSGTRELFDLLAELDAALDAAVRCGDLVVAALSEDESRIDQIKEDVSRGPNALRVLERAEVTP